MKNLPIIIIVTVIVAGGIGFFVGMKYSSSQQASRTFAGANIQPGQAGQRFAGRTGNGANRPIIGLIISADANSITVKLQDGSSKIVLITQATTINKASKAAISDLTEGNTVQAFGMTNSDGSVTAQNIQLNPIMQFRPSPTP